MLRAGETSRFRVQIPAHPPNGSIAQQGRRQETVKPDAFTPDALMLGRETSHRGFKSR